jgi:hypothetical protein
METNIIKFNLKERGRKHTGVERNYNVKAICDAINSPETQERVETRGMFGLYGHWARLRFGLDAAEGGVAEGKAISLEPAFITTYIKASLDGTVEHKAEFLDTASGTLAMKMFKQKVGGFSTAMSALDTAKPRWHGMDYVNEPNFLGNSFRGEALDSIDDSTGEPYTLDSIIQKSEAEFVEGYLELIKAGESREAALKIALDQAMEENTQYLAMLTNEQAQRALDSISDFAVGTPVNPGRTRQIESDMSYFKSQPLPNVDETGLRLQLTDQSANQRFANRMFNRR